MYKKITNQYLVIAFLGLLIFISHYFQFLEFGLYEDDYAVTSYLGYNWNEVWFHIINSVVDFQRPVGFMVITLIPYLSSKFGGLHLLHLTGFFIVWINACLIYYFIGLKFDKRLALVGAVIYILFPALTIRGWLMHTTHMQPTITYLMVALILYFKNKKILSYTVISLSLMTYELGVLPFFLAPLYSNFWNRSLIQKIITHSLILCSMMALIMIIRSSIQGPGDADIKIFLENPLEIIRRAFFSTIIGPITSIKSFAIGPLIVAKDILKGQSNLSNFSNLLAIIPIFTFLSWIFLQLFAITQATDPNKNSLKIQSLKMITLGFITLSFSYLMAFTHYPPKELFGTGTSIHTGAAFAWALLAPGILGLIFSQIQNINVKRIICIGFSAYLSLLVVFHISIQSTYVKSAKIQSEFWNAVVDLCPDLSEGTVIFYDRNDITEQDAITTFSWAISVTLEQIYQFPAEWKTPPRVFPVPKNNEIHLKKDSIDWIVPTARWWAYWDNTPINKIIYLRHERNHWVRLNDLPLNGTIIKLSIPTTESIIQYPKGLIWDNFNIQ